MPISILRTLQVGVCYSVQPAKSNAYSDTARYREQLMAISGADNLCGADGMLKSVEDDRPCLHFHGLSIQPDNWRLQDE